MVKKFPILLFVVLGSLFLSCTKKTESISPEVLMRAEVNGLPWISYDAVGYLDRSAKIDLKIVGDSTGSRITLHIANYTGVGTYTFPLNGNSATFLGRISPDLHTATSGRVVITGNTPISSSQTLITGTFEFLADVVPVSNGSFKIKVSLD